MKYRLLTVCIFLFMFFSFPAWASPLSDGRSSALGGMSVASASPGVASFTDPAVLGDAENLTTSFSQVRFSDQNFAFQFSAGFPLVKDVIGLGVGWDNQVERNQALVGYVRDQNGQYVVDPVTGQPQTIVLGFFTEDSHVFYGSMGAHLGVLSLGTSLKYFISDFGSAQGRGWGMDLGVRLDPVPGLKIGATLFDVGNSTILFKGTAPDQTVPSLGVASLAWQFWSPGSFTFTAEPGVSMDVGDMRSFQAGGGLEVGWLNNVFLRTGYTGQNLELGVGLVAHPEKVFKEIRVDYAYLTQAPDGYPSRVTLSAVW